MRTSALGADDKLSVDRRALRSAARKHGGTDGGLLGATGLPRARRLATGRATGAAPGSPLAYALSPTASPARRTSSPPPASPGPGRARIWRAALRLHRPRRQRGRFANTNFPRTWPTLWRRQTTCAPRAAAPALLVGHSLGGAAVLAAATDPGGAGGRHHRRAGGRGARGEEFAADVEPSRRPARRKSRSPGGKFTIRKQFLEDVESAGARTASRR